MKTHYTAGSYWAKIRGRGVVRLRNLTKTQAKVMFQMANVQALELEGLELITEDNQDGPTFLF